MEANRIADIYRPAYFDISGVAIVIAPDAGAELTGNSSGAPSRPRRQLGGAIPIRLYRVSSVRLVGAGGAKLLEASFPSGVSETD